MKYYSFEIVVFCLALCLIMVGCGLRLSDAQAVELSQARADVDASRMAKEQETKATLGNAAHARLMAGTANLELPPPEFSPAHLAVSLDKANDELHAANASEIDPPAGVSAETLGIIGGGFVAALGLLRFTPGGFGAIASMAHTLLAPKENREDVAKQRRMISSLVDFADDLEGIINKATPELISQMKEIKLEHSKTQTRLGVRHLVDNVLS